MTESSEPWWKRAVIYQIYPRSFAQAPDSIERRRARTAGGAAGEGDGVGDLAGIEARLDHLTWLGVDAIWISPFFTSPMADYGYDVADYCDVDPLFGDLAGFERLVGAAHDRGIRLLIDWVPNHTSDQHPWFLESRRSRDSAKRDWYYWRDGASPGRPPNNWRGAFLDGPAWTWDPGTRQWYLHSFLPQQPDLNWDNPEVVDAMHRTLRFWLDRGVDGFRIDVVHLLGKDPSLPDTPPGDRSPILINERYTTHDILRGLRRLLDAYPGDRAMVGEVYILSTARVARYYGDGDELHMAFNFPPLYAPWDAAAWRTRIDRVVEEFDPIGAWPTWVLSNHDNPRHRTRYGSEARARAAAVLLLTLRGTPFLYAGEELGLEDAVVPPDRVRDPGGRDGCRAPIPWSGDPGHGWATDDPWLPWPPDAGTRNAAAERDDPGSVLHLYRRLLAARRASPALRAGEWTAIAAPEGVLGYLRTAGADRRAVLVNFTSSPLTTPLEATWVVEVSSDGEKEGAPFPNALGPDQAVVLRP